MWGIGRVAGHKEPALSRDYPEWRFEPDVDSGARMIRAAGPKRAESEESSH